MGKAASMQKSGPVEAFRFYLEAIFPINLYNSAQISRPATPITNGMGLIVITAVNIPSAPQAPKPTRGMKHKRIKTTRRKLLNLFIIPMSIRLNQLA